MTIELRGLAAVKFEKTEGALVLLEKIKEGTKLEKESKHVLIAENFYPADTPYILRSRGIISLFGGLLSHASLVAREFDIPAIVGVYDFSKEEDVERVLDLLRSGYRPIVTMYGTGRIVVRIK